DRGAPERLPGARGRAAELQRRPHQRGARRGRRGRDHRRLRRSGRRAGRLGPRPLVTAGRLAGKATAVTGATRGIGRAIARAFAREGADVLVNGRDGAAGRAVCGEIEKLGRRAVWHAADLGQASAARSIVAAAVGAFGRLDVLVNNAGLFERKPALELTEA